MTSVVLVDSGGSVVEYVTVVDDSQQVSEGLLNLGRVSSRKDHSTKVKVKLKHKTLTEKSSEVQ